MCSLCTIRLCFRMNGQNANSQTHTNRHTERETADENNNDSKKKIEISFIILFVLNLISRNQSLLLFFSSITLIVCIAHCRLALFLVIQTSSNKIMKFYFVFSLRMLQSQHIYFSGLFPGFMRIVHFQLDSILE